MFALAQGAAAINIALQMYAFLPKQPIFPAANISAFCDVVKGEKILKFFIVNSSALTATYHSEAVICSAAVCKPSGTPGKKSKPARVSIASMVVLNCDALKFTPVWASLV